MKTFVIAVLAALALQVMASSTPEEMYGMYDKDGKYREMRAKVEQMKHKADEARAEENGRKMRILLVSLFIGFVPVVAVGGQVLQASRHEAQSRPRRCPRRRRHRPSAGRGRPVARRAVRQKPR